MAPLSGEPPADAQGSQGPHNAFEEEVKALKNFVPPHRTAGASVQHEMYPHGNQRTEAAANEKEDVGREQTPEAPSSSDEEVQDDENKDDADSNDDAAVEADNGIQIGTDAAAQDEDREEGELEENDDDDDDEEEDPLTAQQTAELKPLENEEGRLGNWRILGCNWRLVNTEPVIRYVTFDADSSSTVVDPRPKPEETDELDVKLADLPPPSFVNVRTDAEAKDDAEPEGTAKEERQRASDKHWTMFGRNAEASSAAYARIAGQLHHAALKTARRWIVDVPIHEVVEEYFKELEEQTSSSQSELPISQRGSITYDAMPAEQEQRPMEELLRQRRPRGLAQRQRMGTQQRSKERDRRARKKRGFTSEPDIETARKHRRAASSSSQPVDMKREATRLTFHSLKLPVNLLARCLLALGSDETSLARASAACRAFRLAYYAASDEKDREAIIKRSKERDYKDALHKMLEHVHKQVNKEDKEGFFTYAVGPEKAPDYYKLIEHPMDLNTIKKRLQGRYYTPEEGGIEQFEHDMYLIFRNCRSYNPTEAAEVAEANRLQEIANHKLRIGKDVLLKRLWESSYTTEEEENNDFVAKVLADFRQNRRAGVRHFRQVQEYIPVETATEEVERERTIEHPDENRSHRHAMKPPSWWPQEEPNPHRYSLQAEVKEQETYGIDHATARNVLQLLPSDLSEDEKWNFVEETVLPALNRVYGELPASDRRTQSLTMAMDDVAVRLVSQEGDVSEETRQLASAAKVIARSAEISPTDFAVHRKGFGVVCRNRKAVKAGSMVIDFLGEVYPPWRWHEKQDGIKEIQRRYYPARDLPGDTTEFYNMQLERPKGDAKGYGLLFVDAMHKANFSARLAHSCTPNVEVRVKAVNGKYRIHFYAMRSIVAGEELCYDYNTVTDSEEEQRNAFCLCGTRNCRWSYLSLVGADSYCQVLNAKHRIEHRQDLMLRCAEQANLVQKESLNELERVDLDELGYVPERGTLEGLPLWLEHYVAGIAHYLRNESEELFEFLKIQKENEEDCTNPAWEARVESNGNLDMRLSSLTATLSKVRYALRTGFFGTNSLRESARENFENPPVKILSQAELTSRWIENDRSSGILWRSIHAAKPFLGEEEYASLHNLVLSWCGHIVDEHGAHEQVQRCIATIRDEFERLSDMHATDSGGARLKACTDLLHMYCRTTNFFVACESPPFVDFQSEEMPIREDEVVPGVGARGAGSDVLEGFKKDYDKHFVWSQLLQWHEHLSNPSSTLASKRRGVLAIPEPAKVLETKAKVTYEAVEETRQALVQWLLQDQQSSGSTEWPFPINWAEVSAEQVHGSPILDATRCEEPNAYLESVAKWLQSRNMN